MDDWPVLILTSDLKKFEKEKKHLKQPFHFLPFSIPTLTSSNIFNEFRLIFSFGCLSNSIYTFDWFRLQNFFVSPKPIHLHTHEARCNCNRLHTIDFIHPASALALTLSVRLTNGLSFFTFVLGHWTDWLFVHRLFLFISFYCNACVAIVR